MTKRERAEIGAIIDQLMADDGDFDAAMRRLCKLAGREPIELDITPMTPSEAFTLLSSGKRSTLD